MLFTFSSKQGLGTPSSFSIALNSVLTFADNRTRYEVAPVGLDVWYSWQNVSSDYNNNTFRLTLDGGTNWHTITIPNGTYGVKQLNLEITAILVANNWTFTNSAGAVVYPIQVAPDTSTGDVQMTIIGNGLREVGEPNVGIDFSVSDFSSLLGFSKTIEGGYTASGAIEDLPTIYESNLPPDITRGVQNLLLHSNLVDSTVNGANTSSDVIYSFSSGNVSPGGLIQIDVNNRIYVPLAQPQYSSINFYFTDQDNNAIDFNGQPVSIRFEIRERPDYWFQKLYLLLVENAVKKPISGKGFTF